jgi:hypothetical protein
MSTCDVAEQPTVTPADYLAVDLAVTDIPLTVTVNTVRFCHRKLRKKLQAKGTKVGNECLLYSRGCYKVVPVMSTYV